MRRRTDRSRPMPGWRAYQSALKRRTVRQRRARRLLQVLVAFFTLGLMGYLISGGLGEAVHEAVSTLPVAVPEAVTALGIDPPIEKTERSAPAIQKSQLAAVLGPALISEITNLKSGITNLKSEITNLKSNVTVETTIIPELQAHIREQLDRRYARYIGIVVMRPTTGRILAMVGHDRDDPDGNPCIEGRFPAASIFKIVTAAAALETCGFSPSTSISYPGRKYTLYKYQLKDPPTRRPHHITLGDAFAQSINPVFGKIGIHHLGRTALQSYGEAFGFNRDLPFDLPLVSSVLRVSEQPFNWAEIASGFNRTTTISPLHGAMVAATVVNGGRMVAPVLIDRVVDAEGRTRYKSRKTVLNHAVRPEAAAAVMEMMRGTVESGTCRKAFRGADSDPVLARLDIGGKTGSINSRTHESRRYDWFVGFAGPREKADPRQRVVVSVMVAHEKFIGTQARQYGRDVIHHYFGRHFTRTDHRPAQPPADETRG